MAEPGDADNLVPNLTTIAEVANRPSGTELTYNPNTCLFSLREPGRFQSLLRTDSSDSVAGQPMFGRAIRELFASAHTEVRRKNVSQKHVTRALDGLKYLSTHTYPGNSQDQTELQKHRKLKAAIGDAELAVWEDSQALTKFREEFRKHLLYGFTQSQFRQTRYL